MNGAIRGIFILITLMYNPKGFLTRVLRATYILLLVKNLIFLNAH
jgi:hypothetical protein